MRAAQYVRMSTEHQQYSIANQQTIIAEYATSRSYEIVRTYSDLARSGLDIKHRPGLQALIDDVLSGSSDFQAILVFDVSRWGRFQDNDEAACYEFLCKRAGIGVHYCAEPFPNDGSLSSAFLKMVKRTMAAEYLRELSAKVHTGQCRLAASGCKLGGRAGYGLRRLLLDADGKPKAILQDGERKSLAAERVTYTLGPDEEVLLVQDIFSMFLERDMGMRTIARMLNERGLKHGNFGPWDHNVIRNMLTHPKYAGCAVFNRQSQKLGSRRVANPPEQWVVRSGAFPAIVSQDVFDRTQKKLNNMVIRRSNERLLDELRRFIEAGGRHLLHPTRAAHGMASPATYTKRFGSMMAAYELIQHRAARYTMAALESRRKVAKLKASVLAELKQKLDGAHIRFSSGTQGLRLRGLGFLILEIARCFTTPNGHLRWKVRTRKGRPRHAVVVIRLQPANTAVRDFVLLPRPPRVCRDFTLSDGVAHEIGTICENVYSVVATILERRSGS